MKIRLDYVTNSSSSSYIIAFKQEGLDKLDEALKNVPQIIKSAVKIFNGMFLENAKCIIKTKEELDDFFLDRYGWSKHKTIEDLLNDEDYEDEVVKYNKFLKHINEGFAIIEHDVENHDETRNDFFSNIDDGENFILLEGDY